MSIATDLKTYAETALEQGKTAAAESAKPLYAVVGAGEFAVNQAKQAADRAADRAEKLRTAATEKVAEFRSTLTKVVTDISEKAQDVPVTVRKLDVSDVRKTAEKALDEYSNEAVSLYTAFSKRGEVIVSGLSKDVRKTAGDAADRTQALVNRGQKVTADTVADAAAVVSDAADQVEADVAPRKAGARKAAATRTARRTAPKKAPAKKTVAKKAPAKAAK